MVKKNFIYFDRLPIPKGKNKNEVQPVAQNKKLVSAIVFIAISIIFLADMFAAWDGYNEAVLYQITFSKYIKY